MMHTEKQPPCLSVKSLTEFLFLLLTLSVLTVLGAAGCSDDPKHSAAPTGHLPVMLVINPNSAVMAPGEALQLRALNILDDASIRDVTEEAQWQVSSADLAEIDKGLVGALAVGSVTVTASLGEFSAKAEIKITESEPVKLTLSPASAVLAPGETLRLKAKATYDDGSSQDVSAQAQWSASPEESVKVERGLVKALAAGEATVTASFAGLTGEAKITVTEAKPVSLSLDPASAAMAPGERLRLRARVSYDDGSSRDVTEQAQWSASPAESVEVEKGLVKALAAGEATVTASFAGLSAEAKITVTEAELIAIELDKTEMELLTGNSDTLSATAHFDDGTSLNIDGAAEWTSSAEDTASVGRETSESGTEVTVKGLKEGNAVISAAYKGKTAHCKVTVLSSVTVTGLEIRAENGTFVMIDKTLKLKAIAKLSDGSETNVTDTAEWTSSAPDKASVEDGTVTGIEEAESVTITAEAEGFTASVNIQVDYKYIIFNSVTESVPDLEKYLGYTVEADDQENYHIFKDGAEVTELELPSTFIYDGFNYCISGFNQNGFLKCVNLKSVVLPETASYIGVSCFNGCTSLQSAAMSEIVNYIGEYAFQNCSALQAVDLPDELTYILESTFEGCTGLTTVRIPANVTYIDQKAFASCSALQSAEFPAALTSIGQNAFMGCGNLQSLSLPENLEALGEGAFDSCTGLQSVSIPAHITDLPKNVFARCEKIGTVTLPAGLLTIGESAFEDCSSMTLLTYPGNPSDEYSAIPVGVTSIGDKAFMHCYGISVIIPDGCETIGDSAFDSVEHIFYHGSASGQPWNANQMN